MKLSIKYVSALVLASFLLTGCGGSSTSSSSSSATSIGSSIDQSNMNSLMSGGDISVLSSVNADPSSLNSDTMGSLMGGGLNMDLLFGGGDSSSDDDDDDDSSDDSSSSSSSSTVVVPTYQDKGDVFITYNGMQIFFKAIATEDDSVYASAYQEKRDPTTIDGKSYTIRIAGYDTHGNMVHFESGFLVFTFTMPEPTQTGYYDLETPDKSRGTISVNSAQYLDDNSTIHMRGKLMGAQIYNMDQNMTYNIDVDFDVDLLQAAPLQQ